MKIVFPSDKADWNAKLDERFGRADGFVVYDDNDESLTFIDNESKNDGHGVGVQAAQVVIQAGADVVVTSGPFGPKASSVLSQSGIKIFPQMGVITIREALEKVNA
ncbi:MAG: NifB/NifX family molybdenum-iron cluster-binding protein [Bacteroidota bacterium]|nr:NifB/NifX family molybdenum-iron cluster-binding protein [Bacteroidota bacterium]